MSDYVLSGLGAIDPRVGLSNLLKRAGGERFVKSVVSRHLVSLVKIINRVRADVRNPRSVYLFRKSYPVLVNNGSSWQQVLLATLAIAQRYPAQFTFQLGKFAVFGAANGGSSSEIADVAEIVKVVGPIVQSLMDILNDIVSGGTNTAQGGGSSNKTPRKQAPAPEEQAPVEIPEATSNLPIIIGGVAVVGIAASMLMNKRKKG